MNYVGVDLHKHSISLCVMVQDSAGRRVVGRQRLACEDEERIAQRFAALRPFQVVVEATAAYEWFARLVEPLAERFVLAHPKKLRVIAESAKKTDKLDAQTLAEFLALDMIPPSWRPTPRVREHRVLVRARRRLQQRITSTKNALRHLLAGYNADVRRLFTRSGREYLAQLELADADRFQVDLLAEELDQHADRLKRLDKKLREFAEQASPAPARSPRRADDHAGRRAGDGRRRPQRTGRSATLSFRPQGDGLRRVGAGTPPERRTDQATWHHQGRFATAALGASASRLASRATHRPLASDLSEAPRTHRDEEGDRRRRPPALVRPVMLQSGPAYRPAATG
jgi:hypothetical protein